MKNIRRITSIICFFLLFFVLFLTVSDVLARKSLDKPWNMSVKVGGFYNEPKDSLDIMFFGSSHMYCSVDPLLVEELTGLKGYIFATQKQPVSVSYYYMKEALKTQKPDIMVFEVRTVFQEEDYPEEDAVYSALDPLPFSMNKVFMSMAAAPWGERHNYLFNVFKYHDRWEEITYEDDFLREFKSEKDPYRGFVELTHIEEQEPPEDLAGITEIQEPTEKVVKYLNKIIDLSEKEGFQLIFIKSPSNATVEEKKLFNFVQALAEERGIPYKDFNMDYDEIGLDPEVDFNDATHLNRTGADKFTPYFCEHFSQYLVK